jgi:hypothetical protein
VKSINQTKNFGPRPSDGLIKGKIEDANAFFTV